LYFDFGSDSLIHHPCDAAPGVEIVELPYADDCMHNVNHWLSGVAHLAAALCRLTHITALLIVALLLSAMPMPSAFGQSSAPPDSSPPPVVKTAESAPSPATGDLLTRSQLTGDWGGLRSTLADRGVTFDLRYTAIQQGLVAGTGDKNSDFGGKVDAFINLDSGKMGLWEGGGFRSHFEYRHGGAPSSYGGAIFATNTAVYWPVEAPGELVATSLYFTQKLGDRSNIALGKFNPIDLLATDNFFGGWGIDRFMNIIFAAPPSGLIPVVFMGAVANIRSEPVSWTIMVFDPKDRTLDYFPGDLFATGVNFSVTGAHTATLDGRKTTYAVTANYSTAEGTDYSSLQPGFQTSNKKGSYNVAFQFTHNLQESTELPNANWGFNFKAAIADGNPNYVQSSVILGIGGRALFFGRPLDSFGLGAFRYNLSDVLQSSLAPFTKFSDESGIEAFYSYAVTPWLYIGADIQYIMPAAGSFQNALVAALRTQIRF
jgi:porin